MKNVKVKICGIRSKEAAYAAIEAGADFLGFNFVPTSKRYIEPKKAKEIIEKLQVTNYKLRVAYVGVFQNAPIEVVNSIAEELKLDFVQLHGEEDREYMQKVRKLIIKRVNQESRIKNHESIKKILIHDSTFLILDRDIQGKGKMVDVGKAKEIARKYPIFLAGGLTAENVAGIIKSVQPFAVDVAGGIETEGKEDREKIRKFIKNAKNTDYNDITNFKLQKANLHLKG